MADPNVRPVIATAPDTATDVANRENRLIRSFRRAPPRWRCLCSQVKTARSATDPNNNASRQIIDEI